MNDESVRFIASIYSTGGLIVLFDPYPVRATLSALRAVVVQAETASKQKPKHKMARKQQALATTLCEELQASNWIYKSRGAPARGIGPPLV